MGTWYIHGILTQ